VGPRPFIKLNDSTTLVSQPRQFGGAFFALKKTVFLHLWLTSPTNRIHFGSTFFKVK